MSATNTLATLKVRTSCSGAVNIATLKVGRKVVYETRAWGTAWNASEDANAEATKLGLTIKGEA